MVEKLDLISSFSKVESVLLCSFFFLLFFCRFCNCTVTMANCPIWVILFIKMLSFVDISVLLFGCLSRFILRSPNCSQERGENILYLIYIFIVYRMEMPLVEVRKYGVWLLSKNVSYYELALLLGIWMMFDRVNCFTLAFCFGCMHKFIPPFLLPCYR